MAVVSNIRVVNTPPRRTSQHYQDLGGSLIAYAALPKDAMHIYCTSNPATEIINILLYSEMEIVAPHHLIE